MNTLRSAFKDYSQDQLMLFPPSLSDLVPEEHPVRTINKVIDAINIDNIVCNYIKALRLIIHV